MLDLHGVRRELEFLFDLAEPSGREPGTPLTARGSWVVNRRDFDIIWHPWLD